MQSTLNKILFVNGNSILIPDSLFFAAEPLLFTPPSY